MKTRIEIALILSLSLVITNCSLFGGGSSESGKDAYADAESAYGSDDQDETNDESPDKYVAPDTYGDADEEPGEVPALDLDNEGYSGADENAQADVTFGENEGVEEHHSESHRDLSATSFKQGMYDFADDCQMRLEADVNGTPAGMIRSGKKLWVEPVDGKWLRVYKKSGPVFISRHCL